MFIFHHILFPTTRSLSILLIILVLLTKKVTPEATTTTTTTTTSSSIGLLSFWSPELYALLDVITSEGNAIDTYIYSGRKFYVTKFRGHDVVAVNTGVGLSNTAATTAIMLQKFPSIDRIVGSGIAGGVNPSLRVGDVTIPRRWALYQKQHFAKEETATTTTNSSTIVRHEIPSWQTPILMGDGCGNGFGPDAPSCEVGVTTWNYSFIYPASVPGADPTAEGIDATSEGSKNYWWFDVDDEMYTIASSIASTITLSNSTSDNNTLDYQPVVVPGGNGISGPTFVDNADFRDYCFKSFDAAALDMETAAAAHVATQMGVRKFIFFRSLSDLAGADQDGNVMGIFFTIAAANAVKTMTAFLENLPVSSSSSSSQQLVTPNNHSPGSSTPHLLGILSFYQPELEALKSHMSQHTTLTTLTYGGRIFYRGTIHGADVVAVLTGIGISNAAMTTALMLQLYPGIERLIGGGIAGGIDPKYRVGDVIVPKSWVNYQMQLYAKEQQQPVDGDDEGNNNHYEPPVFELDLLVGKNCGGFDGVDEYLTGEIDNARPCDVAAGETSNYGFIFPKTIQTPEPMNDDTTTIDADPLHSITEGPTRKWKLEVDSDMFSVIRRLVDDNELVLQNEANGVILPYTPKVVVLDDGIGVSGPTFLDNAGYRDYLYEELGASCVDMETAAAAHVAYQCDVPFLFFRSLSDLAGADQDANVMGVFFTMAAENAFAVTSAFIEALYPVEKDDVNETETQTETETETEAEMEEKEDEEDDSNSGNSSFMTIAYSSFVNVGGLFVAVSLWLM